MVTAKQRDNEEFRNIHHDPYDTVASHVRSASQPHSLNQNALMAYKFASPSHLHSGNSPA